MQNNLGQLHSFGFTDANQAHLKETRSSFSSAYKFWLEVYYYQAQNGIDPLGNEGTLLHHLSEGYDPQEPTPLAHLATSAECCIYNMVLLLDLIEDYQNKNLSISTWAIGSISRSVLISASRILYVLSPDSLDEKKSNLQRVHIANLRSRDRYQKVAQEFTVSRSYNPYFSIDEYPVGRGINDSDMTKLAIDYLIKYIDLDSDAFSASATERIKMMWNIWSGQAHGMEWPTMLDNKEGSRSSSLMPGDYPLDFLLLSGLVLLAMHHCRDAFLKQIDSVCT